MTKILIELNLESLLGKAKEIDITKLLDIYQRLNKGETIKLFDNNVSIKKIDEVKV